MKGVWGIILAAGESKRMGSPKMLLPVGRTTMIETVVDNLLSSAVEDVIVVTGAYSNEIGERISRFPVKVCHNGNYRDGMLSSVKTGFSFLPGSVTAVVVLPGDYPGVKPELINSLVEAYYRSGKGIAVPVCNGKRGHPVIISAKYREEVACLDTSAGLRGLLTDHPDDITAMETGDFSVLHDIDTPDDYIRELNK